LLLLFIAAGRKATNSNFIVFGLTQPGLKPDEFRILNFDGKQLDFVLKKIGRIVSIIIIILKFYSRDCNTGSCEPLILSH
jgi:hypothetical protein